MSPAVNEHTNFITFLSTHNILTFNFPLLNKPKHFTLISVFDYYLFIYSFNKWMPDVMADLEKITEDIISDLRELVI